MTKDYEKLSQTIVVLSQAMGKPCDRIELDIDISQTMTQANIDDMEAFITLCAIHKESADYMFSMVQHDLDGFKINYLTGDSFEVFTKGYMAKLRWVHKHKGGKKS